MGTASFVGVLCKCGSSWTRPRKFRQPFKMSSINLLFSPSMRVGGEVLHGEVELRFPQVIQDEIEEVHVKLRGKVYA